MDVPERLKQLMDERKMNIYALSKASGLSWQTIKNIFILTSNPSVGTMAKICEGLGITMSQFFAEESENTVVLTEEQQLLLNRWNVLGKEEKRLFSDLMGIVAEKNG